MITFLGRGLGGPQGPLCTTKLCSMLQQRLEEFYQDAEAYPLETAAQKRAPGMEFLGKRSLHHQQFDIPNKRAPGKYIECVLVHTCLILTHYFYEGMEFLGKRSMDNPYEILPYDDNIF